MTDQNFAHFQQFSRPGAKGNTFARVSEVPRCEAACVLCQRKDWIEYRHKLNLFGKPPNVQQGSSCQVGGAPDPDDSLIPPAEDTDDEGPVVPQIRILDFKILHFEPVTPVPCTLYPVL